MDLRVLSWLVWLVTMNAKVNRIDWALAVVQGSFLAAAKLLDLEPQQLRNAVNHYPALKRKWGRRRGRGPSLPIRIAPFCRSDLDGLLKKDAIARKLVLLTLLRGTRDVDAVLDGLVTEALARCRQAAARG